MPYSYAAPAPRPAPLSQVYEQVARFLTGAVFFLAFCLLAGCGASDGQPGRTSGVAELQAPTGPGSGEPFLSSAGDTVYLSWLEPVGEDEHALLLARRTVGEWSDPVTVARRDDFFVNWADFPSVRPGPDGTLWAHWLQRGPDGGYDYGVRVASSADGGATWSDPLTPHEDGTPQEHGFVSLLPRDGGAELVWLDGRFYERGPDGGPPTEEMTLRYRAVTHAGADAPKPVAPTTLLDPRSCDCCQTAAVRTPGGPVVFYRDRSPDEIRDIAVTALRDGRWTEPVPVARDGWEIAGCPVNGPAAAARGDTVVVAWFTAPDDVPSVRVAFSTDGGSTFGPAHTVDDGNPAGRVDLVLGRNGEAVVVWLERTGGDAAEIRGRVVARDGPAGDSWAIISSSSARASGFPRAVSLSDSLLLLAWTGVEEDERTRVRMAQVQVPSP